MELPAIASSTYSSTPLNMAQMMAGGQLDRRVQAGAIQEFFNQANQAVQAAPPAAAKEQKVMSTTRLVQVFIADPSENVPLDKRLLHRGEQKLTDLTDQELFFEIDIKSILDAHNAARVKMVDKTVKERTEHLEPARIRDLKMTVVTIAQF